MPKYRNRVCKVCGDVKYTASKSDVCLKCKAAEGTPATIQKEIQLLVDRGYIVKSHEPNKFGGRMYNLITPCCGSEWKVAFGNMRGFLAKPDTTIPPCPVCGPKRRMSIALEGYMDKHARDYDLEVFEGYSKEVRILSDINYKNNIDLINPKGLKRGVRDYHLDHKVSIVDAFKLGWPAEKAAGISNLQMLWCTDNLSKGRKSIFEDGEEA